MDMKREISIGEFDQSIIQLQKHKFKLLEQVEQINLQMLMQVKSAYDMECG